MNYAKVSYKHCVGLALAAAGLLSPRPSAANNDVWKTAAGGTWGSGASWVDGSTPLLNDKATFNLPGTYTVSFSGNPAPIQAVTVSSGNVTFASSSRPPNPIVPRTLELVAAGPPPPLFVSSDASLTLGSGSHPFHVSVDDEADVSGRLTVAIGSNVNVKRLVNAGRIEITGTGSSLTVTSPEYVSFFDLTDLKVSLGGLLQTHGGNHGDQAIVTGAGSRWKDTGVLRVGWTLDTAAGPQPGSVFVERGGLFESTYVIVGSHDFASGFIIIQGDDTLWTNSSFLIIGGAGQGTVQIRFGGNVRGGDITVAAQGRLQLYDGTLDVDDLSFQGDGQFEWGLGTLRVGTYRGDLNNQFGTLAPGHSAGTTTILGDYAQQALGILEIEIGGADPGTQHDVVNVRDAVQLAGQLDLKFISGFVPTAAQTFAIMSADSISGAFSNVANGGRLTAAGGGSFRVNYGPGSAFDPNLIMLSAFQAPLPGDYNDDGTVDAADYTVWRNNLGAPAGTLPNDIDGGAIGTAQYATWKAHYGSIAGGGALTIVPEPGTMVLLMLAATGWLFPARLNRASAEKS